jgi:MFS transporter, DHA3 family, multidrug efflux protein
MASSGCTLVLYALALAIFVSTPAESFRNPSSATLWTFVVLTLVGAIVGNARSIALSTLVTIMVPEDARDRANGLVGTANGVGFLFASVLSGLAIGFLGAAWMLLSALAVTALTLVHLATLSIPGFAPRPMDADHEQASGMDPKGTLRIVLAVPGLMALILFQTFNNFLGGIYMALMDAYGLLLMSVQLWGILWGILSLGFIVGGLVVSRKGLGRNPVRTLLLCNVVMWTLAGVFTLQASIVLLGVGMFGWLCLIPVVEASEQTILQKVTPPERQGRVFGFAQSIEQAATPITAFLMGPIAELYFIPFMTTGAGVDLLGPWFGTGKDRGLALLFTAAGVVGLVLTVIALRSDAYRRLSERYRNPELEDVVVAEHAGMAALPR